MDLVRRLAPDSLTLMEFKAPVDLEIANKLLRFPVLGRHIDRAWNLTLHRELHMTDDAPLFTTHPGPGTVPLVEGKMVHQFEFARQAFKYWVSEAGGRQSLIGRGDDVGQVLPYQRYRLAHRSIGRSTDERTMIATILPPGVISGHSLNAGFEPQDVAVQLCLLAFLNSFVFDYYLRQQVSANLTMFFIYQSPVPRLLPTDKRFATLVQRAARLVCTSAEFDKLAKQVGMMGNRGGATDPVVRNRLRAEIDGLVAHCYGLDEIEFSHVLAAFPLVPQPVKVAAHNAYRDVERGLIS